MAGRKKGTPKTGGRKKGTPNKRTLEFHKTLVETGLTPLEYFLEVMRDEENETSTRLDAAKSAAPYCHPRKSPETDNSEQKPITLIIGGKEIKE